MEMMSFNDYIDQVRADAAEAVREGIDQVASWDEMADELYIDDSVTGNGSGSYTFNSARARENVCGLIGDSDFWDAARAMGYGGEIFERGAESIDVIARCLALDYVIEELEEVFEDARTAED